MRRAASSVLLVALAVTSCTTIEGRRPSPTAPTAADGFTAGAAIVDITPPPGYRLAGHAPRDTVALGVWTRLVARAIVLTDAAGTPLALVAVDLWATPAGLVDRVAERVADDPRGRGIARAHLVVAASHTAHGPAGYGTNRYFNAQTAGTPGFDPELFEFLAGRIAEAILRAADQRVPARVLRRDVAVPTLARNDDVAAFASNPEAKAMLAPHGKLPGCMPPDAEIPIDPCHAIDPLLTTFEVVATDASAHPIAIAGVFAMHPGAMPASTAVYHADVFGLATARATRALSSPGTTPPVVALFGGAQADAGPNVDRTGRAAATELGHALGEALVLSMSEPGAPVGGTIGLATGVVAFSERPRPAGLQRIRPPDHFAHVLPVAAFSVGPARFVTVPGELTTMMGRQVAARVGGVPPGPGQLVAIGFANGYGYTLTTADEHDAWTARRDGGGTVFGPLAGNELADALARVSTTPHVVAADAYRYRPGPTQTWASGPRSPLARDVVDGERVPRDLDVVPSVPTVTVAFDDAPSPWPVDDADTEVTPRLEVQGGGEDGWTTLLADGQGVDDRTGALAIHLTGVAADRWTWHAIWLHPAGAPADAPLRLRIRRVKGAPVCSAPFSLSAVFGRELSAALPTRPCMD